jgi:xylulokinase
MPAWLQIKADVTGRPLHAAAQTEATLLGAAILAGMGAGVYGGPSIAEALATGLAAITPPASAVYLPDTGRHETHRRLLALYLALQGPIRQASAGLATFSSLPCRKATEP